MQPPPLKKRIKITGVIHCIKIMNQAKKMISKINDLQDIATFSEYQICC